MREKASQRGGEIHRNNRKEGNKGGVDRSMTRNSAAAMVISSGVPTVINEWINRESVERRCIDDTRESGVVSFTREIHASRDEQRATFAEFEAEFAHGTAHITAFHWDPSVARCRSGRTVENESFRSY